MRMRCGCLLLIVVAGTCLPRVALGLENSVPAIGADLSQILLGDGTGVIVGIIDSGVDDTHPGLAGLDSLGFPRLVAESNFVTTEPLNTGDDIFGHGTAVAGVAVGNSVLNGGVAPDARYVNARVLDRFNSFGSSSWVRDGVGFAMEQGADILNLSLNFFAPVADGTSQLDLMLDWATEQGHHVAACAGNISQGSNYPNVRGPGSVYNGLSVGRTTANFRRVHSDSASAFTEDGRMKPDVVAPGTGIQSLNNDWETGNDFTTVQGCSFATPHVAGLMAQQLDYGFANGLSTSPLVIKATLVNASSREVLDRNFGVWEPAGSTQAGGVLSVTQPLDTDSGAGQINGVALYNQYSPGQFSPGIVRDTGWDLGTVSDQGSIVYEINVPLPAHAELDVTLSWFRHVSRFDDGNGVIDAGDLFAQSSPLDDLNFEILRAGATIARSISSVDNLEHLKFTTDQSGMYAIRVIGNSVVGGSLEAYALAWRTVDLPGDFDGDGDFACADVDALVEEIISGTHDQAFDMTGDALVDRSDLAQWLATAGSVNNASGNSYLPGDANLDGFVDGLDFVVWNDNKFASHPAWCLGDFTADGVVDGLDYIVWNEFKFSASLDAVPEPVGGVFLCSGILGLLLRDQRANRCDSG
jgi:hypothetical protein